MEKGQTWRFLPVHPCHPHDIHFISNCSIESNDVIRNNNHATATMIYTWSFISRGLTTKNLTVKSCHHCCYWLFWMKYTKTDTLVEPNLVFGLFVPDMCTEWGGEGSQEWIILYNYLWPILSDLWRLPGKSVEIHAGLFLYTCCRVITSTFLKLGQDLVSAKSY